jgi:hypothetical protein
VALPFHTFKKCKAKMFSFKEAVPGILWSLRARLGLLVDWAVLLFKELATPGEM